jgi:hypothetical protein
MNYLITGISWREQVNFQWNDDDDDDDDDNDDDEVLFVLDQHTELYFYNASSL